MTRHTCPDWFRDAKFGLFFHWGPYSVPAYQNEWYSRNMYAGHTEQHRYHLEHYGNLSQFGYKDFIPMFTGDAFDPDAWADLAQLAGARYAGPVSEHADNYSLWNSRVNPINSVQTGPHRDIVGECFSSLRKRNIRTLATFHHQWLWGWFMSTDPEADVYDPANEVFYGPSLPLETNRYMPYRLPDAAFNRIWRDKVLEVIDQYAPDALYFDSRANIIGPSYKRQIIRHFYESCPHGILTYKQEDFPVGSGIKDLECGRFTQCMDFPWQTDDRLEDNVTWCIVQNPKYKSAGRIIQQLADVVSKNGNLLLNVGPQTDGSFHPDAIKTLKSVGAWLQKNGEVIYDTRPYITYGEGPTQIAESDFNQKKINEQLLTGIAKEDAIHLLTSSDIRYTTKDSSLYAIILGVPADHQVLLTAPLRHHTPVGQITLLSNHQSLPFQKTDHGYLVLLPDSLDTEALALKLWNI